jgi:hypothetical protein
MLSTRCAASLLACALAGGCFLPNDHETGTQGGNPPRPTYDVDQLGVPRFVGTSYIDLAQLTRISLFRSHEGHDYSDDLEPCRSMKHYFKFPTSATTVYAPVSGVVRGTIEEWAGTQVQITSTEQPAFTFVIFHVTLASPLVPGASVTAGQVLGTHVGTQTFSDIAVEVNAPGDRRRLVSYFDTLTDAAFAPYAARGIASRAALVITRAQRDAAPLTCVNHQFTDGVASDPYPADVAF